VNKLEKPIISVIMSVYNTPEKYLRESIESILNQSFRNFEFIIINDGSSKENVNVIKSYEDKRIKLINNTINVGLTKSLNIGISNARGKYIARMDSDDISISNRFEKQLEYMEKNEDVIVLGGFAIELGNNLNLNGNILDDFEKTKIRLLFYNATFPHATAFIRKEALDKHKLNYDENILKAQDYALWADCLKYGKIASISEVLILYRIHENQITNKNKGEQSNFSNIIKLNQLRNFCNILTPAEEKEFLNLMDYKISSSINEYKVIKKLLKYNKKNNYFNAQLFEKELLMIWIIKALKRLRYFKKLDFIKLFTLRIFLPSNIIYFINYFIVGKVKRKFLSNKLRNKYRKYISEY
jgi:glycosyltransferase involved in cell wall biosynthesis